MTRWASTHAEQEQNSGCTVAEDVDIPSLCFSPLTYKSGCECELGAFVANICVINTILICTLF